MYEMFVALIVLGLLAWAMGRMGRWGDYVTHVAYNGLVFRVLDDAKIKADGPFCEGLRLRRMVIQQHGREAVLLISREGTALFADGTKTDIIGPVKALTWSGRNIQLQK